MSDRRLMVLNLALPGAGLVVRGHLALGIALVLPALLTLAVAALAAGILVRPLAFSVVTTCLGIWATLSVIAATLWWRQDQREHLDPVAVRAIHREAAAAWLKEQPAEALAAARRLVVAAPEEPGAWQLLARIAQDAGDPTLARRAARRAATIEAR